jgi:hypothetical protein
MEAIEGMIEVPEEEEAKRRSQKQKIQLQSEIQ